MFSLFLFFVFLVLAGVSDGKDATSKLFQWQFDNANGAISSKLPSCQELPIIVQSYHTDNSTHGKPPYYMISFAVGGQPMTTFIGTNESALSWTITQAVGTKLILGVADSDGSSGGISPLTFTVVAGQSTQCINTPPSTNFQVTANVTDTITTCQPWGLRVKGGVAPYQITLLQPNSPVVTNVTFSGPDDDAFTFIDRADPNSQIMAAISDMTGQWANGSVLVNTIGSPDVDCVGLVSSSGNSTDLDLQAIERKTSAHKKKNTNIAIGVVVPIVLLALIGVGLWFFFRRRRGRHDDDIPVQNNHETTQFIPVGMPRTEYTVEPFNPYADDYVQRPPSKLSEAATDTARRRQEEYGGQRDRYFSTDESSAAGSSSGWGTSNRDRLASSSDIRSHEPEEIVIQHQDGGEPIVRELPPPYVDRSNGATKGKGTPRKR